MRVVGIGIDVEKIAATDISISRYGASWLRRQFTNFEIDRAPGAAGQAAYFTSLFAVKEAVSKAIGTGIDDDLPMLSIQVTMEGSQIESIVFLPPAAALVARLGLKQVNAGVATLGDHIIATAIAEE